VVTRNKLVGVISFPITLIFSFLILFAVIAVLGCSVPAQEVVSNPQNLSVSNASQEVTGTEFGGDGSTPWWSKVPFAAIFVGPLIVGFLVALYIDRTRSDDADTEQGIQAPPQAEELGSVAGAVADEMETGTDNGVYRAWVEMTDVLDIANPETSTPREFAEAARSAGIAPADVDELTELFEEVRYGTESPTQQHEQRALDALRRIEQTYSQSAGTPPDKMGDQQ
jgi:hypothetical protein